MIEAFREIDRDEQAVEDCWVWLITRKRTTDWGTTTATADAVHALLSGGRDLLAKHRAVAGFVRRRAADSGIRRARHRVSRTQLRRARGQAGRLRECPLV